MSKGYTILVLFFQSRLLLSFTQLLHYLPLVYFSIGAIFPVYWLEKKQRSDKHRRSFVLFISKINYLFYVNRRKRHAEAPVLTQVKLCAVTPVVVPTNPSFGDGIPIRVIR